MKANMNVRPALKNTCCVFLYVAVLFYLLPFNPFSLSYIARHSSPVAVVQSGNKTVLSSKKTIQGNIPIQKKIKAKFKLDYYDHQISPNSTLNITHFSLLYVSPENGYAFLSVFSNTNKGPPSA
jgi:hypothetical protein